jgi:hypothetical protein
MTGFIPLLLIGVLALYVGWRWWQTRRRDPYDLSRLWDSPTGEPDPDAEAEVTADSGPYCAGCDHPNPPGTHFCRGCGRHLG